MEVGVRGAEDGAPPCFVGPGSPFLLTRENQSGRAERKVGAAFEGHRIVGGWWGLRHYTGDLPTFLI